ncbi:MAG: hypothetical protein NVS4B13_04550 [Candidatus Elarobacter sp.]
MVTAARTTRRDRIAITGSIAIHLGVLAFLVALPHPSVPVDDADERTLSAPHVIQIEHRAPPAVTQTPRALAQPAPTQAMVPVVRTAVTVERAARKLVVAAERAARSPAPPAPAEWVSRPALSVTQSAPEAPHPVAGVPAERSLTTAPSVAPAPSPVVAQREEGIGNFGETYPAAVDPAARNALFAGTHGVVVRVTVDENGRATAIDFVRSPADAMQRDELRARLLAARFIPAACNGLRCAGTVELRN